MPDRYNFKCRDCGFVEFRYRNVKRCRKCHGLVDAQKPPTYAELKSIITAQEDIIKRLREDAECWHRQQSHPCLDFMTCCQMEDRHNKLMNELGEK